MGNAAAMPAFPAASSATPTIKLLIAKDAQVVVLAEAGKDAIDFLVGLIAMPLGAVCKLTGKEKESTLGAIANIYASVQRMDHGYMQSPWTRDALLNPAPAHPALAADAAGFPSLVQQPPPAPPPPGFPMPPSPPAPGRSKAPPGLPSLKGLTLPPFNRVGGGGACLAALAQGSKGFVRGLVTYTVTDELNVTPMSNISSIALLHRLGVEDLGALEERTVKIGYQEGLEILKASFNSKTVLTDVFLTNKKKRARNPGDKNGATSQQQEKRARIDAAAEKEIAIDE